MKFLCHLFHHRNLKFCQIRYSFSIINGGLIHIWLICSTDFDFFRYAPAVKSFSYLISKSLEEVSHCYCSLQVMTEVRQPKHVVIKPYSGTCTVLLSIPQSYVQYDFTINILFISLHL